MRNAQRAEIDHDDLHHLEVVTDEIYEAMRNLQVALRRLEVAIIAHQKET